MNFEERLAQTQTKLDELKAKINDSIESAKAARQADRKEAMINLAKMNAAIEDFGRDVEAQVYCDVTSMKAEAQADVDAVGDAIDEIGDKITAKAEAVGKALDEADDKIDAKVGEIDDKLTAKAEAIDKALDEADDKIDAKVGEIDDKLIAKAEAIDKALDEADDKIDAKVGEIDDKIDAKLDKVDAKVEELDAKIDAKLDADAEKYDAAMDKIDAKVNDDLDAIEGDYYAAKEDVRLAKERYDSKLNATRLKVQMHMEDVKNRIEAKKTELDKAAQEELIMDLLDYADDCQMIAYAYAMEAELAILDACDEIEDYDSKYGKTE